MLTESIYLLTALLIHLSILSAGLSISDNPELLYQVAKAHFPAITFSIVTAIVSLFEVSVLSKVLMGISLALTLT